jgi:hypothetical protein
MPAERLAFMQAVTRKVLTDPAVVAEGEKTQRYVDYLGPEETRAAAIKVVSSLSEVEKKRVKDVLSQGR